MTTSSAVNLASILFPYVLLSFGLVCAFVAAWVWRSLRAEGLSVWEKLPRSVVLGMALGALDLAWCVPHAEPVFYIGARQWLIPLAFVLLGVAYYCLDYLFSRALAGFLILLAHYFLLESFAAHTPVRWLFSLLCVVMGTFGVFLGGMPYLLRDLIRRICAVPAWRSAATGTLLFYAAACIVLAVWHFAK